MFVIEREAQGTPKFIKLFKLFAGVARNFLDQ